jgi:hypothetical protein
MRKVLPFLALGFQSSYFLEPLFSSYKLVKQLSKEGGVDDSHNEKHAKEVLFWTIDILRHQSMSKYEMLTAAQCALLHDTIDPKYPIDFTDEVRSHLALFHETSHVDVMLKVMNTISYSKVVVDGEVRFPSWMETNPTHTRLYHTVREADLLASFNIARMIEYRHHLGGKTDKEIREEVLELYDARMGRLVERGLFVLPGTRELAGHLDAVARAKLRLLPTIDLHDNLDILRIVHHLSIFSLLEELENVRK